MSSSESDDDARKELNFKLDMVAEESLESTRRMLAYCEDSKEQGIKTLVMLDDQGEQLERVEDNLDTMDADLKQAEDHLKGMEEKYCCGLCVLPWNRHDFRERIWNAWRETLSPTEEEEGGLLVSEQPRTAVRYSPVSPQGGYITRITNDHIEDEMDDNMLQVSSMLSNLRDMALDMCTEVSNQSQQLDRIGVKAQTNNSRVNSATTRATKLIN